MYIFEWLNSVDEILWNVTQGFGFVTNSLDGEKIIVHVPSPVTRNEYETINRHIVIRSFEKRARQRKTPFGNVTNKSHSHF